MRRISKRGLEVGAFNLRRLKALPTTTDRITSSWELPRERRLGFLSRPRLSGRGCGWE